MIARLLIVFGEPDTENVSGYLAEIAKSLAGYHETVQNEACDLIMKSYRGRQFPTPSICRKACEDVVEQRGQADQRKPLPIANPEWSGLTIARADRLIQSDLGRCAANEGWVLSLHDFCRKHGRLPVNHEVAGCRSSAKKFDEAYCDAQAINGPMGLSLIKLGNAMLVRRDALGRLADGDQS